MSAGTAKQVMPLGPAWPVRAMMMYTSLRPPPEMNILLPFKTYESPSRTARVLREAASDPAPGSVKQYEAKCSMLTSLGRISWRNSSLPNVSTIHAHML